MKMADKYNIAPGAQVGSVGDNATSSGQTFNQTVVNNKIQESVIDDTKPKSSTTTIISGQVGAVGPNSKSSGNVYKKYVNDVLVEIRED
jgi:hypothetical protein